MEIAAFDYELPKEAIAQTPAEKRDESRLLLVDRQTGLVSNHTFKELPYLLEKPYHFIRNTVSVLKARLRGRRQGGGEVECFLLEPDMSGSANQWHCLLRPGKKIPVASCFGLDGHYEAKVLEKTEEGTARIEFSLVGYESIWHLADSVGEMPLPPYIDRKAADAHLCELDKIRYQTVYADPKSPRAVAAPTAGLHFTDNVIRQLVSNGHEFHDLSLHVGLGTFKPIQTKTVEAHQMHREFYEIPASTLETLASQNPKLIVGTTSLRATEDLVRSAPEALLPPYRNFQRYAEIFIYPPDRFHADALLTNFHLPRSSLLCLVAAFLTPGSTDGIQWLKQIYTTALDRNYRFYSYGDAMLIL